MKCTSFRASIVVNVSNLAVGPHWFDGCRDVKSVVLGNASEAECIEFDSITGRNYSFLFFLFFTHGILFIFSNPCLVD